MARTDAPNPISALQRVASFHCDTLAEGRRVCFHCGHDWPCPTYQQVEQFVGEFRREQRQHFASAREYADAERNLRAAGHPAARVEARALLAAILGIEPWELPEHAAPLDEELRVRYRSHIRRLAEGEALRVVLADL